MNLDKCIGCHTCSVTCKQVWTNRTGTEYVWFNNVETKPGYRLPQATGRTRSSGTGAGRCDRKGRLKLKAGGQAEEAGASIFANPDLPHDRRLLRAVDL